MAKPDGTLEKTEKLMPEARTERTFECGTCGNKIKAKAPTAVCTGVTLGVLVRLPDGKALTFVDGSPVKDIDDEGNDIEKPWRVDGEVIKINGDGHIFSHDSKKVLDENDKWTVNNDRDDRGFVPGEHGRIEMQEVK